jgi:hypothetical protein
VAVDLNDLIVQLLSIKQLLDNNNRRHVEVLLVGRGGPCRQVGLEEVDSELVVKLTTEK